LWLRWRPVDEEHLEGKVRRTYQIWGELVNESSVSCDVALIRGTLLYNQQAAGYGLAELANIGSQGRVAFNFYGYQLADEGVTAIVIPGFHLDRMLQQLGLSGTPLGELLRSGAPAP
jgi:hypothetical protein